jgi:hypothetical protein
MTVVARIQTFVHDKCHDFGFTSSLCEQLKLTL